MTAAAVALTVAASGMAKLKTTVLMTPEEVDQATKEEPCPRRSWRVTPQRLRISLATCSTGDAKCWLYSLAIVLERP